MPIYAGFGFLARVLPEITRMKRALRNTDTSMFIKSDLTQTGWIEQAQSFPNYQEAFEFCNQYQLNRVELVVRVSDNYEFVVEVPGPADLVIPPPRPEATSDLGAPDTVGAETA